MMNPKPLLMTMLMGLAIIVAAPAEAGTKVLFYMHGSDLHGKGPDSSEAKNYDKVLAHLKGQGLEIVYEMRPEHDAEKQAARTAEMVKQRLAAGTPPQDIIVGGFSYGAMVTLVASGMIDNPKVNYALFCGCPENPSINVDIDYTRVKGRILAIIDKDDGKFGPCAGKLAKAGGSLKEVTIESGKGHKVFKLPKEKFLKHWVPAFTGWAGL